MGLQDVSESRIGSNERRGISGGERRRLSIGLELIAAPSILILDEPTTGLDSVSALKVVDVLRHLSLGTSTKARTTVIATIHQPSSRIFHAFDHVCVLASRGRQVYFGRADRAEAHFRDRGHPLPAGFNMADHLLEISTMPSSAWQNGTARPHPSDSKTDSISPASKPILLNRDSSYTDSDKYGGGFVSPSLPSYGQPPSNSLKTAFNKKSLSFGRARHRNSKPVTTIMTQVEALSWREMRILVRKKSLLVSHIGIAVILGVFL